MAKKTKRELIFVPAVRLLQLQEERVALPQRMRVDTGALDARLDFYMEQFLSFERAEESADLSFVQNDALPKQGYTLRVAKGKITIAYCEPCGAFYALTTLRQLLAQQKEGTVPALWIEDAPSIPTRGLMLDVSRGRMSSMETICKTVDLLANLKYNHMQLYFDSIVFDYPGLEDLTAGKVLYTPEQIKSLDRYCAERFIELVPNQNSFGHMESWMHLPALSHLGVTWDDGTVCGTINPLHPQALPFIEKLWSALLPSFTSGMLNIGCDEICLGQGNTRAECEKLGRGEVYLRYLLQLYHLARDKYGKTPLFWDDIVMNHPELIDRLPKDLVVLEWGYEHDHPFEQRCRRLHETGLRYYVAPGTSTWNSLLGRTPCMTENIRSAAKWAKAYGAEGLLLTDWGDNGHPQPLACSLITYIVGGMYAWYAENEEADGKDALLADAAWYANRFRFKTEQDFFSLVYRFGKYSSLEGERHWNDTGLYCAVFDKKPIVYPVMHAYIEQLRQELAQMQLGCADAALLCGELENISFLMLLLTDPEHAGERWRVWLAEYERLWDIRSLHDSVGCGLFPAFVQGYFENAAKAVSAGEKIRRGKTDIRCYAAE